MSAERPPSTRCGGLAGATHAGHSPLAAALLAAGLLVGTGCGGGEGPRPEVEAGGRPEPSSTARGSGPATEAAEAPAAAKASGHGHSHGAVEGDYPGLLRAWVEEHAAEHAGHHVEFDAGEEAHEHHEAPLPAAIIRKTVQHALARRARKAGGVVSVFDDATRESLELVVTGIRPEVLGVEHLGWFVVVDAALAGDPARGVGLDVWVRSVNARYEIGGMRVLEDRERAAGDWVSRPRYERAVDLAAPLG